MNCCINMKKYVCNIIFAKYRHKNTVKISNLHLSTKDYLEIIEQASQTPDDFFEILIDSA